MNLYDIAIARKLSGGGGGGTSWQTVFEGSVTTEASQYGNMAILDYSEVIEAETIKVTFNGTEYECNRIVGGGGNFYGGFGEQGPDFSVYPFAIQSSPNGQVVVNAIYTETTGTYTLKIEEQQGGGGGGGSSDFSTAEVTVTNSKNEQASTEIAYALDDDGFHCTAIASVFDSNQQVTFNVILYKGLAELVFSSDDTLTISGDAEDAGDGYVYVTGDCTITIS